MKVLHLISGGDTGGAKTHVHSLLQGLGRQIDVSMVCFTDGPFAQEARELGIDTQIVSGHNIFKALRVLQEKVRTEGYQLLHCHGARGNLMGWLLKRATGLPVISTVHSDYKLDYMGRPFSRLTYGTINAIALRQMDYHIGVSDATVDMLIDRGFHPDKIYPIYNGLDFSERPVQQERDAFFAAHGLKADADSVVVGIAARLNPVKDIPTLIRGFAKAYTQCPKLRLVIAGDGQQKDELVQLAAELGVADVVCFAGWLTDVDSFYHAIDINTLTSLSETFPYSLTEGARAHLPTVATRVGGVPYLIEHGVTGLLFTPGDTDQLARHLVQLATNADLRRRMGQLLYEKAKQDFSLESTISRQIEIYETILRRETRPKTKRDGVIICGAYGRGNAGDDAILEAIIAEMRALDPDMPLWVLSRSPKNTRRTYRVNAVYTFNVPGFRRHMRHSKLYINGGGSLMQDVTSHRSLWFYLYTISAAKRLGCQVMMYGCGIGPIHHPDNRRRAARIMNRYADVITLRDFHSSTELASMGVTKPEIVVSADPTVILPASPRTVADGILETFGLDPSNHFIGFTVRPWPGFKEKAPIFAAAADYAYERYGFVPVFLPIEARLDTDAARLVAKSIRSAPYKILPECSCSAHTIGLFARMDVVVSMRLHALVFAAGHSVPLVGVVYDQKVSSFLDAVGQDLYTDLDALTAEGLTAQIDAAVARIGDTALLNAGVERLRQAEHHNSECAQALLKL